jgi:hypothetical protein
VKAGKPGKQFQGFVKTGAEYDTVYRLKPNRRIVDVFDFNQGVPAGMDR